MVLECLLIVRLRLWTYKNGWTLLHKAAYDNSVDVAELVLRAGAKVDTKGNVRAACGYDMVLCADSGLVGRWSSLNGPPYMSLHRGMHWRWLRCF